MKERYEAPAMYCEEFIPNHFVAGCTLNIVSGTEAVRIYCVKTSYVTVFTNSDTDCTAKHAPFTSAAAAQDYFGQLFQWGDGIAEGTGGNSYQTNGWTQAQTSAANSEINNGQPLLTGTIDLGGYNSYGGGGKHGGGGGGRVHAGYCLDYLNGFAEGKALS